MNPLRHTARFDPGAAFLRALSRFLHGEQERAAGPVRWASPTWMGKWRERLSEQPARTDALSVRALHRIKAEDLSRWTVEQYPKRRVPAVAVGSASGALLHLYAALGIPWLPQTHLLPVRTRVPPEDAKAALAFGAGAAERFLKANAELELYHQHDPVQDRARAAHFANFRVKRTRLGAGYSKFLRAALPPGGTIFVVECRRAWPVTRVGPRHVFQLGAEARVSEYLEGDGEAEAATQDAPEPTELAPEAEWGFAPELLDDLEFFGRRHGYKVARVVFDEPDDPSAQVADLYAWWYGIRQLEPARLMVESALHVSPYWALRTGSVPFWLKDGMEDDAARLDAFLGERAPWAQMFLVRAQDGEGRAFMEKWRELLDRAREQGELLTPPQLRSLPARHPLPGPLSLAMLERFLADHGAAHAVKWLSARKAAPAAQERAHPL